MLKSSGLSPSESREILFHGSLVAINVLGIRVSTVRMQHQTYLIKKDLWLECIICAVCAMHIRTCLLCNIVIACARTFCHMFHRRLSMCIVRSTGKNKVKVSGKGYLPLCHSLFLLSHCNRVLRAGIYDATMHRIIAFTMTSHADPSVPKSGEECSILEAGRGLLMDAATRIWAREEYSVVYEPLDSFKNEEGSLRVRLPSSGHNKKEKTADYARFFVKNGHSNFFGLYSFRDWNCENFASFCETAFIPLVDLEKKAKATSGNDAVDFPMFTQEFLKNNSNTVSLQAISYIKEGGLFRALKQPSGHQQSLKDDFRGPPSVKFLN